MRIGMILNAPFPPDIRVEKEAQALRSAHRVFLLCTCRDDDPVRETIDGVEVTRVFGGLTRRGASLALMRSCYSTRWKKAIDLFVQENAIDVLHVHDLPLAGTAIDVARSRGIKIVLDLHEDYPAMLAEIRKIPLRKLSSIGVLGLRFAPSLPMWRKYERRVVDEADAVVTVVEESSERIASLGVDASKIHTVPNYSPIVENAHRTNSNSSGKLTAIYIGGFDQARDLATVVGAAAILESRAVAMQVLLVGGSTKEIRGLDAVSRRNNGGTASVSFREWMKRDEAESLLDDADIGLVPHVRSPHTETTIPHKLFQYMARGLPVVVSDCAPLARIVGSSSCGLVYRSGDPLSLAERLEELNDDPRRRERMGLAGIEAVRSRYSWEAAASSLLETYTTLR